MKRVPPSGLHVKHVQMYRPGQEIEVKYEEEYWDMFVVVNYYELRGR